MKTTKASFIAVIAGAIALAGVGISSANAAVSASFTLAGGYEADFSLINGDTQMQLVLTNSGTGDKQGNCISGIDFAVSGFTLGALTSATATDGIVNPPSASVTLTGSSILASDEWASAAGPAGDPNELSCLTGSQPDYLIIGPSFGGAGSQFDPYVNQVATFVYDVSNVDEANTMWGDANGQVIFRLGTTPDSTPGSGGCTGDCTTGSVPEPASLSIVGLAAAGLLLRRRKA